MKTKLIYLITLAILFASCQEKEKETITILSGKLPGQKESTITLVPVEDYFPGMVNDKEYISTEVDSSGYFTFKGTRITAGFYQVIQSNYHRLKYDLYLEEGDSIYVEQSAWNEDPFFNISGKGAEKLQFLVADYKIFPDDKAFNDTIKTDGFETELIFKDYIDSIFSERMHELTINASIPKHLKNYFMKSINGEKAMYLLKHLERRNYFMSSEFEYFHPETAYYSFLEQLDLDDVFCQSTASKKLANTFLLNKARIAFKVADAKKWWEEHLQWKFNYIAGLPKSKWTDLLALSTVGEYSFGLMEDNFFQNLLVFENKMDTLFSSRANQDLFLSKIKDFQLLAPGNPAPHFALPDSNGVLHGLDEYKGKIVYIDFWGTWCYPCIEEMPESLELHEKYKDDPVVFMYVALEYDEENIANWKRFISGKDDRFGKFLNNEPFPGVHLVAEKQFRNEKLKPYKINFAPTYVLLDQDGSIVKARADRPDNISEHIDQLLEAMYVE